MRRIERKLHRNKALARFPRGTTYILLVSVLSTCKGLHHRVRTQTTPQISTPFYPSFTASAVYSAAVSEFRIYFGKRRNQRVSDSTLFYWRITNPKSA